MMSLIIGGSTVEKNEMMALDISDDEIRENFKLLTQRPITQRTLSVGKCIANIAQWHVIELLKLGLMPLKVGNYYLIKAEVLDELFREPDEDTIDQSRKI
jgi:hypothetical protein